MGGGAEYIADPVDSGGGAVANFYATIDEDYGAACDGQMLTDGGMNAGSPTLTSAAGPFTSADVGKTIVVNKAGTAGGELITAISAYISATQVTLASNASTTVSGQNASWGTDDTAAIQAGIDALYALGGGRLYVPYKRVFTRGYLNLKENVVLCGKGIGPYDLRLTNPGKTTIAPTLFATDTSANAFITAYGHNTGVEDLLIFHPNQIKPNDETTPKVYPYAIKTNHPDSSIGIVGFRCRRNFLVNPYKGIYLKGGRAWVDDIYIGSIETGIEIDRTGDYTRINNIHMVSAWASITEYGGAVGSSLDNWIMSNGYGIKIYYADHLTINNYGIYRKHTGILIDDSTIFSMGGTVKASYGVMNNVGLDLCIRGIYCKASQPYTGWVINGLYVAGYSASATAVICDTGGSYAPKITVNGGNVWNLFAAEPFVRNAGTLIVRDVRGYNPKGSITAPSVPASGTAYTNNYPYMCRVNVYGGTVTTIAMNGAATGLTSGSFVLDVGETITLTYSSVPSWTWFGV